MSESGETKVVPMSPQERADYYQSELVNADLLATHYETMLRALQNFVEYRPMGQNTKSLDLIRYIISQTLEGNPANEVALLSVLKTEWIAICKLTKQE
jgi:hypothetical protein